ncbi:MAG: hypothetical protein Q9187_008698, partial [Circinaria calcarea]
RQFRRRWDPRSTHNTDGIDLNENRSRSRPGREGNEKRKAKERVEGIVEGIEGTIGNTPLVRIKSLSEATGCEILGKAEFLNGAGGSPKDRVAVGIIQMVILFYPNQISNYFFILFVMTYEGVQCVSETFFSPSQAEEKGFLRPHSGDVIYEGTVGSTGISLATLCRAKGYRAHM